MDLLFIIITSVFVVVMARRRGRTYMWGFLAAVVFLAAESAIALLLKGLMIADEVDATFIIIALIAAQVIVCALTIGVFALVLTDKTGRKSMSAPIIVDEPAGSDGLPESKTRLEDLVNAGVWTQECDDAALAYARSLAVSGLDRREIKRELKRLGLSAAGAADVARMA